jgi:hypothetical protein
MQNLSAFVLRPPHMAPRMFAPAISGAFHARFWHAVSRANQGNGRGETAIGRNRPVAYADALLRDMNVTGTQAVIVPSS